MTDDKVEDKDLEKEAEDYAEEHHISAIVDKPGANILFAKKLSTESYLAGLKRGIEIRRRESEGKKEDAKTLFMLMAVYTHGLTQQEFDLAQPRLALEFLKFKEWLRSRNIELTRGEHKDE